MFGPLEDLNLVPCIIVDLLLNTSRPHKILLRIQLATAQLPVTATLRTGMSDKVPPRTKAHLRRTPQVMHVPLFQYVAPVLRLKAGLAICIGMLQGMRLFER